MEAIIILLLMIFGPALLSAVFKKGGEVVKPSPQPLNLRLTDSYVDKEKKEGFFKIVEAKGILPLTHEADICFVTSVLDVTGDTAKPVICSLDNFQELDNVVYQDIREMGRHGPGVSITEYINVGAVIPEIMTPPYSGTRKLAIMVRLMDKRVVQSIQYGFIDEKSPGVFGVKRLNLSWDFDEKGYEEAAEHREKAGVLTLKLGVMVAMADGNLDETEGNKLKEWIIKNIAPFEEQRKSELKSLFNDVLKSGFDGAKAGTLTITSIVNELNEVADKNAKYEAVELCFDVMAADGVADQAEIKAIRDIATKLGLDMDKINAMRDQRIVALDASATTNSSVESMLGISLDWDNDQVKKHLRKEFSKWNNRLNTLNPGPERDNAQRMLDSIAELRKKYG